MIDPKLLDLLKHHEGFRGRPYIDTMGRQTIGYGHNLDALPLTQQQGDALLLEDVRIHANHLAKSRPIVLALDPVRYAALVDMAFNLGVSGVLGFKHMWDYIEQGDWENAGLAALNSRWAAQVGFRAEEIAEMLLTGRWPHYL